MADFALQCRKSLKRHAEAISIVAFIFADCFAAGWMLAAGTVAAILYVVVPALRTIVTLSRVEQVTFMKAYVKTQKVQKVGLLLFWLYSVRFLVYSTTSANLFAVMSSDEHFPSLSSALFMGAQQFVPLAFVTTPVLFYAAACFIAIHLRSRLKATKQDPDLVRQRQRWCGASHFVFLSAFVAGILAVALNVNGPAYMISNWLLASAKDAFLFGELVDELPNAATAAANGVVYNANAPQLQAVDLNGVFSNLAFVPHFDIFIIATFSITLFVLLLKSVLRLNAFLSSFCWRVVSPWSLQNIIEGFLEALRLPSRSLTFSEARPVINNAVRTLVWLFLCYGTLFWIFGFCGGPLGYAIQNWMMASAVDAGIGTGSAAPDWLFQPSFRIFTGSIVALYGTAPVAVTCAIFLPYVMARKITVNCDGILFSQGPYLALLGRQFRLWSDLKSMTVKVVPAKVAQTKSKLKAKFALAFRSGGRVTFTNSQLSASDLKVLLDGIDQHASDCAVDPKVYEICNELVYEAGEAAASDGIADTAIEKIQDEDFKSTIFVPFSSGEFLPGTKTRIIKQLSSKPLCAVYLARDDDGRMLTVKQFYLADENDETRALAKILQREYELLSRLDHPGIAKVISCFSSEKSTFLVIEHRLGSDMREIVKEHGPRSEALTIEWAKQLAKIMIYLHGGEPPITHRDLTPDNVIVGEDGQVRLIDFGAAREFLTGITGTMLGKHCYVSPEQLRGEATPRSDIYSFGATLYFLLTGRDPIALSQSSPLKNVECSEPLDRLIQHCTEFDENKRPQSFEELLNNLCDMDQGFRIKISRHREKAPA